MSEFHIDFSDVQDADIPEGWYAAFIFGADQKVSSNGNAMLSVQVKLSGGAFDGRTVWDNWMLETDALFRTKSTLVKLGLMSKEDKEFTLNIEDLVGLECEVKIRNEEYEGEMRPRIRGYRAPTGETVADLL